MRMMTKTMIMLGGDVGDGGDGGDGDSDENFIMILISIM